VYMNPNVGVISGLAGAVQQKTLMDCSTIDFMTSLEVGKAVAATGKAVFADTPVSGGPTGAAKGTLTFMIGAAEDAAYYPLMEAVAKLMGRGIFACGGPSLGLGAKLSNNYLSSILSLGTSEAMNLGMRIGLSPHKLQKIFSVSTSSNYTNDTRNPVPGIHLDAPASKGYAPGFKIQLSRKDIGLAVQAAHDVKANLILGPHMLKAYIEASEDPRYRDLDSRIIYRYLLDRKFDA
jgi:3-hydroxyisobutyrate dehydrogenase-like beta-hydroxyacid dehydrogenase